MLGKQEKRCDDQDDDQRNVSPGLHPANIVRFMLVLHSDPSALRAVRTERHLARMTRPVLVRSKHPARRPTFPVEAHFPSRGWKCLVLSLAAFGLSAMATGAFCGTPVFSSMWE